MLPATPPRKRRFPSRSAREERRGVALVMVLGSITILTVFLTDLQQATSTDLAAALTDADSVQAEYAAKSAINVSRLLISAEPVVRTSITPAVALLTGGKPPSQVPIWEFAEKMLSAFNGGEGASSFGSFAKLDMSTAKNVGFGERARFEVRILDEDSKINVNLAADGTPAARQRLAQQLVGLMAGPQYDELFQRRDADEQFSDRQTVCGAMVDWVDGDEELFPCDPFNLAPAGGAEDNFYQTLGLSYFRKNAPLDSLEELRLVRGVGDDFWSTFVEPDPSQPDKRVLTVWGQGAVNVNTANAQTLLAVICAYAPESLLCTDPSQMSSFLMGVSLARSFTRGFPLFASGEDFVAVAQGQGMLGPLLGALGVAPVAFANPKDVARAVTTKSSVFSIYADGYVKNRSSETRLRLHSVVDFRSAPALSVQAAVSEATSMLAAELAGQGPQGPPPGAMGVASEQQAGQLVPMASPFGTIVYHRTE